MHSPLYKKDKLSDDHVYTTRNQTKLKYDTKTKHFYDESHKDYGDVSNWSPHLLHTDPDFDIMSVYADNQNKNHTEKYPPLAFRDCSDIDKREESCVLYTYSTRFYDMELVFKLSVSDIALNNATKFLSNEHIIIPDAFDFKLTMTLPFIPSKEEIQEYEDIIKSQKEINGKLIEQVRFAGYNYVYPATEKTEE